MSKAAFVFVLCLFLQESGSELGLDRTQRYSDQSKAEGFSEPRVRWTLSLPRQSFSTKLPEGSSAGARGFLERRLIRYTRACASHAGLPSSFPSRLSLRLSPNPRSDQSKPPEEMTVETSSFRQLNLHYLSLLPPAYLLLSSFIFFFFDTCSLPTSSKTHFQPSPQTTITLVNELPGGFLQVIICVWGTQYKWHKAGGRGLREGRMRWHSS